MNVLVTGGTGTLGRHVVMLLRQSGHRARIMSREPRGHVDAVQADLRTGRGVAKALAGMDAVIHAASATRQPLRGRSTDVLGTRRLLGLAREEHIKHVVYVSIVGIDRSGFPYHRTKLKTESVVKENIVPWTILRATQFHEFVEILLHGFSRLPAVVAVPLRWQIQPVDSKEVAQRLVDAVIGKPAGMLPDFGGPEVRTFESLARAWLIARKDNRRLVNLPVPFEFNRQSVDGILTSPDHKDGKITFDQYLAERYPLS
jgi:uncharacterized protein YbjT (DUF2867 family)